MKFLGQGIEIPSFAGNAEKIAAGFVFRVNPDDIQKSIDFLLANGFLTKDDRGKMTRVAKTISTVNIPRNDELVLIAKKYHLRMLELAGKALLELPKEQRSVTNTTLSMSEKSFELALKRIETMRYELLELAAADSAADRVCQLNVNLFPLVKKE